jgi:hypothetical protein
LSHAGVMQGGPYHRVPPFKACLFCTSPACSTYKAAAPTRHGRAAWQPSTPVLPLTQHVVPPVCHAGKRVGTHEHLLQQQQQQQQHGAGWEGVLKSTLLRTSQCTQHATSIGRLARSLHRVNHGTCGAARATIRHLSLTRYQRGRQKAKQLAAAVGGTATSAMAAAAVAPPLPWDLLAATPSLTSLDMRGDQLEALMEGGGDAATAAAAAASSAAPAAAPASLAAILGRLRCLRVDDVCGTSQLTHLGQLLAGTTQLTQLVIKVGQGHQHVGCSPLLEAPQGAQQGSAAAAAAAAGPGGGSSAWLPALCHLEVLGDAQGLLPALLGEQQAASQLTRLHLKSSDSVGAVPG